MRQLMSTQKKKVDKKNNGDIFPLNIHNWKKKQNIINNGDIYPLNIHNWKKSKISSIMVIFSH